MKTLLCLLATLLPAFAGAALIIPAADAPSLVKPDGSAARAPAPILGPDGQAPLEAQKRVIIPDGAQAKPGLVRPDGTPLSEPPAIALPEGSIRLDPSRPVLEPGDPEAAPLIEALERREPVSGRLAPGARELAAEAEKPSRSAVREAIAALEEAGAFDGARAMKKAFEADSFAPAKDWAPASRFDIEDKLRAAARLPAARNHAAIRALFLKYGDRLDWAGVHELLSRLAPSEDASRQRLSDELTAAFLRERAGELPAAEFARIAATISDPALRPKRD